MSPASRTSPRRRAAVYASRRRSMAASARRATTAPAPSRRAPPSTGSSPRRERVAGLHPPRRARSAPRHLLAVDPADSLADGGRAQEQRSRTSIARPAPPSGSTTCDAVRAARSGSAARAKGDPPLPQGRRELVAVCGVGVAYRPLTGGTCEREHDKVTARAGVRAEVHDRALDFATRVDELRPAVATRADVDIKRRPRARELRRIGLDGFVFASSRGPRNAAAALYR